jgi:hypothetical protein
MGEVAKALFATSTPDWVAAAAIMDATENVAVLSDIKNAAGAVKAVRNLIEAEKMGKIVGTVGHAMASVGTFLEAIGWSNILFLAADIAITIIVHNIVEAYARKLRNRQAIMLMPLKYQGLPFTAGINGSQGMIIGSQPSAVDKYLTSGFLGNINQLAGIQVDYDNSDVRSPW